MKIIYWLVILAIIMSGELNANDFESRIESALSRTLLPDQRQRELAKSELAKLPVECDKLLISYFEKSPPAIKLALIEVFALRKQKNALEVIIFHIEFLPEVAASRIASGLGLISDDAWLVLRNSIKEKQEKENRRSPKLEKVYEHLVRENIILFFKNKSQKSKFLYEREEFSQLYKYGSLSVKYLSELIFNENNILGNFPIDKSLEIRDACVRLLGDSGLSEGIPVLKKALQTFRDVYDFWAESEEVSLLSLRTRCALSLYNLGDTHAADTLFARMIERINSTEQVNIRIIFMQRLIEMQLQVHKYKECEELANNIIELITIEGLDKESVTGLANAYYTLAVINGIMGISERDDEAKDTYRRRCIQALKQAVRLGFIDLELIYIDRNVRIVWNTGEFNKWIERLRQDEKLKDKIPTWEPGNPPNKEAEDKTKKNLQDEK